MLNWIYCTFILADNETCYLQGYYVWSIIFMPMEYQWLLQQGASLHFLTHLILVL